MERTTTIEPGASQRRIMADLITFNNLTARQALGLAIFWGLMAASLVVWILLLRRAILRRPICSQATLLPSGWTGLAALVTLLVAFLAPPSLVAWTQKPVENPPGATVTENSGPEPMTAARVRRDCILRLVQVAILFLVPVLIGPMQPADFGLQWSAGDAEATGLGFLAIWFPVCAVNAVVSLWRTAADKHELFKLLDRDPTPVTIAWVAASVVLVAPLFEELFYRVVLQGWLQARFSARFAVPVVAAVFAAAHGWLDALPLFLMALILGYVYHCRRSLLVNVLLHALFNGSMLTVYLLTAK